MEMIDLIHELEQMPKNEFLTWLKTTDKVDCLVINFPNLSLEELDEAIELALKKSKVFWVFASPKRFADLGRIASNLSVVWKHKPFIWPIKLNPYRGMECGHSYLFLCMFWRITKDLRPDTLCTYNSIDMDVWYLDYPSVIERILRFSDAQSIGGGLDIFPIAEKLNIPFVTY